MSKGIFWPISTGLYCGPLVRVFLTAKAITSLATVFRSAPSRRSCSSVIPVVSSVYSAEDVQTHSLIGRNVPDNYRDNDDPDPDRLAINDEVGEVIEVGTTPDINPEMFRRRVKSLMLAGLSQQEAEKFVASTPQKLELFYDVSLGAFAIDAEAVGNTPWYNPYTGKEIPDETE